MIWCSRLTIISIGKIFRRLLVKSSLEMKSNWKPSELEPVPSGVWCSVVPNFNLNHRNKFEPPLNFISKKKLSQSLHFKFISKTKLIYAIPCIFLFLCCPGWSVILIQVDIQKKIDLCFPLYFVFCLLSWLISHFNSRWYPKPNWFMLSLVICFSFVVLVE